MILCNKYLDEAHLDSFLVVAKPTQENCTACCAADTEYLHYVNALNLSTAAYKNEIKSTFHVPKRLTTTVKHTQFLIGIQAAPP